MIKRFVMNSESLSRLVEHSFTILPPFLALKTKTLGLGLCL